MRTIRVCDTTLRDCEHVAEFNMSVKEKVEIARQMERLGVDLIDLGAASDALPDVAKELKRAVFSIAVRPKDLWSEPLLNAISAAHAARINLLMNGIIADDFETLLHQVGETAREKRIALQLTVDALCLSNPAMRRRVSAAVQKESCESLCIYDDVGYCTPSEMAEIVALTIKELGEIPVSVKCKNDLGMATANTLAAVKSGASAVECSINGLGRRAGNAALEQIVMAIAARADVFQAKTNIVTRLLYRAGRIVSEIVGLPIAQNAPILGEEVLTRQQVPVPEGAPFSAIRPEEVGIFYNNLVLGSNASQNAFEDRTRELGYLLSPDRVSEAYNAFRKLTERKKVVTDRDIEAIIAPMESLGKKFELQSFWIQTGGAQPSHATVVLLVDGKPVTEVAQGYGPVDAALKAVDRIAKLPVTLDDFAINAVTEGEDALGDAMLRVRYDNRMYTGRGLSTDIVEAAIRAYLNTLDKVAAVSE